MNGCCGGGVLRIQSAAGTVEGDDDRRGRVHVTMTNVGTDMWVKVWSAFWQESRLGRPQGIPQGICAAQELVLLFLS